MSMVSLIDLEGLVPNEGRAVEGQAYANGIC